MSTTSSTAAINNKKRAREGDTQELQHQTKAVTTKKDRRRATIHHICQDGQPAFSLLSDVYIGALVKAKMVSIIPLTLSGGRPVLVQLSGGGNIPSFGVEQNPDKPTKFSVVFNVDSNDEHSCLQHVRSEMIQLATDKWQSWFPDQKKPSDELLQEQCNALVGNQTPKQNSEGFWPGTLKSTVERSDLETGRCQLRDVESGTKLQLTDLAGMKWTKAVVELRSVYILANRSYGITKRLRYLECTEGPMAEEIIPL
jgi:hypothetical protein